MDKYMMLALVSLTKITINHFKTISKKFLRNNQEAIQDIYKIFKKSRYNLNSRIF